MRYSSVLRLHWSLATSVGYSHEIVQNFVAGSMRSKSLGGFAPNPFQNAAIHGIGIAVTTMRYR